MNMEKTRLLFEMVKQNGKYTVDPNSIIVFGKIPNWGMLTDFLFSPIDSSLPDMIENMPENKSYNIEALIWLDSDDVITWIDNKIVSALPID